MFLDSDGNVLTKPTNDWFAKKLSSEYFRNWRIKIPYKCHTLIVNNAEQFNLSPEPEDQIELHPIQIDRVCE